VGNVRHGESPRRHLQNLSLSMVLLDMHCVSQRVRIREAMILIIPFPSKYPYVTSGKVLEVGQATECKSFDHIQFYSVKLLSQSPAP
jgi:hypothetical protein